MFKYLQLDKDKIYPTLVISTMSSGKSTLINALIGNSVLPSKNAACTAKNFAILDNDTKKEFTLYVAKTDGTCEVIDEFDQDMLSEFNESDECEEIILEGQIKGIKNSIKSLLLYDTPGINNSADESHATVTKNILNEYTEGLILYVINAGHLGSYDDYEFLSLVSEKIKKCPNFNIIFVVNKMDVIDPEKESPQDFMQACKNYLEDNGIKGPNIIPVSSIAALLFKKVLQGIELTRKESADFTFYYDTFKSSNYSFVDYVLSKNLGDLSEKIEVRGMSVSRGEIYSALYNTGLVYLETVIDEALVYSLKLKAPKIKMSQNNSTSKSSDSPLIKNLHSSNYTEKIKQIADVLGQNVNTPTQKAFKEFIKAEIEYNKKRESYLVKVDDEVFAVPINKYSGVRSSCTAKDKRNMFYTAYLKDCLDVIMKHSKGKGMKLTFWGKKVEADHIRALCKQAKYQKIQVEEGYKNTQ